MCESRGDRPEDDDAGEYMVSVKIDAPAPAGAFTLAEAALLLAAKFLLQQAGGDKQAYG